MARRTPAAHLCLRVGARYEVAFVPFPARAPMFVIGTGSTLISVTLPEQLEAGHVDFARQLAARRGRTRWRSSAGTGACRRCQTAPVPYRLTPDAEALLGAGPERADLVPLPGGQEVTA